MQNLKVLLANINIRVKNEISKEKNQEEINRINYHIARYVYFVAFEFYGEGTCVFSVWGILEYAPELENTEIMDTLMAWKRYFDIINDLKIEQRLKNEKEIKK